MIYFNALNYCKASKVEYYEGGDYSSVLDEWWNSLKEIFHFLYYNEILCSKRSNLSKGSNQGHNQDIQTEEHIHNDNHKKIYNMDREYSHWGDHNYQQIVFGIKLVKAKSIAHKYVVWYK